MVLLPVAADPTVSFSLQFAVGSQNDPAGKEGVAGAGAGVMTGATAGGAAAAEAFKRGLTDFARRTGTQGS